MTKHNTITIARKMQGKPDDVTRQLPEALGGRPCKDLGDGHVEIREGPEQRIDLRITPLGEKEIGSLELPMQRVELSFEGYDPGKVETIMAHFDASMMRVGGGP